MNTNMPIIASRARSNRREAPHARIRAARRLQIIRQTAKCN